MRITYGHKYIDFPTGWWMQHNHQLVHTSEKCSALTTDGAFLCDCDALKNKWAELNFPRVINNEQ